MPPARIVVIGANGFVGNAVASRLETEGMPVLRVTRRDVDLLAPRAAEVLAALLRPDDAVVAASALAPCKNADMLVDNMVLARAMAAALKTRPVAHVVNIGSDAIYADGPLPLSETAPTAPDSLHGAMHLAREVMFRAEVPGTLAFLRPTLIYGAADPHNGYGPNRFRRLAARGEDIVLFGEGEERRDHVLVDDVAEIVRLVLTHRSAGVLNVATGTVTSFRHAAELAVAQVPVPPAIRGTPRVGSMPHGGYRPFDISACAKAFPAFRYTPLAEGMARAHTQMLESEACRK